MIVQNNGNRKYLIDGLVIESHKTYKITQEQYERIKGFGDIKPLCIIKPQQMVSADKDKNKDKSNTSKPANKNLADKDKNKDKQPTDKIDNEQQSNNNK